MDPKPNLELLDRLEQTLIKNPGRHDQGWWMQGDDERDADGFLKVDCQTTLCAAGWAATLAGGKWVTSAYLLATKDDPDYAVEYNSVMLVGSGLPRQDTDIISAYARAKHLLGLTEDEAWSMFYGSDYLTDVQKVMARVRERAAEQTED